VGVHVAAPQPAAGKADSEVRSATKIWPPTTAGATGTSVNEPGRAAVHSMARVVASRTTSDRVVEPPTASAVWATIPPAVTAAEVEMYPSLAMTEPSAGFRRTGLW
jgi:hypothetical protein